MTSPLPDAAIEAGARAMVRADLWSSFWSYDDARQLMRVALSALAAEGLVVVPLNDLSAVVAIAARNEAAPPIDNIRAMIEAAREG